ncbi:MAG: nucleotidyltransferase family protein [Thermodesulfovibrionales bacterium]
MEKTKIMPLSEILHILRNLKAEVRQRYKAEIKGVFGSHVRGEEGAGSDIDILVEFDEGANLLDLTGLSIFLEEKLYCTVDIIPESAIRVELKEIILKETVCL